MCQLTELQTQRVLQDIASSCYTALQLACSHDSIHDLDALSLILQRIGFMADQASGATVVGDYAAWMLGPSFREGEAQANGGAAAQA